MINPKAIFILFSFCIISLSCKKQTFVAASEDQSRFIETDKPVKLKIGEIVTLKSKDLDISFSEVINDSRCPINADCIHQGFAILKILIGEEEIEIKFENGKEDLTIVNEVKLQILELVPKRNLDIPFSKDDYYVTLIVRDLTQE